MIKNKTITKESFEYFIDSLEEKVKNEEIDTNEIFKILRRFKDRFFYSVEELQK